MPYDDQNVFARVLRGEIDADKVHEDDHALAFRDIHPQAPVHLVVIPKGDYETFSDFTARASDEELAAFLRAVGKATEEAGLAEAGYRLISNCGEHGHQEVPHFHVHVLGGRHLGPLVHRWHAAGEVASKPPPLADDEIVLLEPHDGQPSPEQVQAYAEDRDLEPYDAAQRLRATELPRVLCRGPEGEVGALAARLEETGLGVRRLPTRHVLLNLDPWVADRVEYDGDTIVLGWGDERVPLELEEPALMVRGQYQWLPDAVVSPRLAWASGVKTGKTTTRVPKMVRTQFAHLYVGARTRPYALIEARITDWSFLGEDMTTSAFANFDSLCKRLLERFPERITLDDRMLKRSLLVKSLVETFWHAAARPDALVPDVDAEVLSRIVRLSRQADAATPVEAGSQAEK